MEIMPADIEAGLMTAIANTGTRMSYIYMYNDFSICLGIIRQEFPTLYYNFE